MCRGRVGGVYVYICVVGIHSLFGGCCGWWVGHFVCGRSHVRTELCNKNGGGEADHLPPCLFDALQATERSEGGSPTSEARREHPARPVDRPVLVPPTLRTVQVQVAVTSCFQPTPQCSNFNCLFLLHNRGRTVMDTSWLQGTSTHVSVCSPPHHATGVPP